MIDLAKASRMICEQFPERLPIGYWIVDEGVIIRTKPFNSIKNATISAVFLVEDDYSIRPVLPFKYDLDPKKYKQFK